MRIADCGFWSHGWNTDETPKAEAAEDGASWSKVPPSPRPSPPGEGGTAGAVESCGPNGALAPRHFPGPAPGLRRASVLGGARKEAEAKRRAGGWGGDPPSPGRGAGW